MQNNAIVNGAVTAPHVEPKPKEKPPPLPEKLSDAEQLVFLKEQLAVVAAERNMARSLAAYYEHEKAVGTAMDTASKRIQVMQAAKCAGCQIDAASMTWVKPAAPEEKNK